MIRNYSYLAETAMTYSLPRVLSLLHDVEAKNPGKHVTLTFSADGSSTLNVNDYPVEHFPSVSRLMQYLQNKPKYLQDKPTDE